MARPRLVAWGIAALLALICWAALPASANATTPLPEVPQAAAAAIGTVESTVAEVATVPQPVKRTVEQVAKAVEPAVTAAPRPVAAGPVSEAPAAAPKPSHTPSPKQARAVVASAAASSSVGRLGADRKARRASKGSHVVAEQSAVAPRPVFEAAVREAAPAAVASDGVAAMPEPAPQPEPVSGFAGGATASGASTSFLFGGGLALLVAALLLAGPGLLRRLTWPPAVCRPAAFVLVLERPG